MQRFLLAIAISAAALPAADAQGLKRVGMLNVGSPQTSGYLLDALRQGLRDLGYVEGQNIRIEARWARGHVDRLPALASELTRLPVDVIVAGGPPQVRAAQKASGNIPIVMASGADPVALGFAASLARPGGKITGSTNMATETSGKLVQFAHEVAPKARRLAVLMSDSPSMKANWNDARAAAKALNIALVPVTARTPEEIEAAFASAVAARAELLIVVTDAFLTAERRRIIALAADHRMPAVYSRGEFVLDGGLISYGIDLREIWRHAAVFVDKILKGAKPAEIPFEQPTTFELLVNLKTAKTLGIDIPQSILLRSNRVIE